MQARSFSRNSGESLPPETPDRRMSPKNCSLWVAPALFSRPRQMASFQLLLARKSLMGWPVGTSIDSEDTLVRGGQMACNR